MPALSMFVPWANFVMVRLSGKKLKSSQLLKTPMDRHQIEVTHTAAEFMSLLRRRGIPFHNGD
jgi:hypothetical protein